MKLMLKRGDVKQGQAGELWIDDTKFCDTLEPIDCVPNGKYNLILTRSNRFRYLMPLLYNTPDDSVQGDGRVWSGIRIHSGNSIADTQGCILPGIAAGNGVINSRMTFRLLMDRLIEYYREPNEILKIVIV